MTPHGLNVDETVMANSLEEEVVDTLGYGSEVNDLNSKIIFASFRDDTFDTYTDYNRVFRKGNDKPLVFPHHTESYPDGSGVGLGHGLKYNTGTLIVECGIKVSAIRVKPPCSLEVNITSGLSDLIQFVGSTVTNSEGTCSELFFVGNSASVLVLQHVGSLSLNEIQLFSSEKIVFPFSTFPILKDGRILPYLVSELSSLINIRKGGLREEKFAIFTVELLKSFENSRIAKKEMYNLSLEQLYIEEASLYDHILKDSNSIFPIISLIEQNCLKHQKMTQASLKLLNMTENDKVTNLECNILCEVQNDKLLFNGMIAPNIMTLIADVKYIFNPETIEVNGSNVSEIKLRENETIIFEKNGTKVGIFNSVKKIPKEIYELPSFFMNESSLHETVNDVMNITRSLSDNISTLSKTPNIGNIVSHVAFVDENGNNLTCEESIFLPSDVKKVKVDCSDSSVPIFLHIDGEFISEIKVTDERFGMTDIQLPDEPGVHALSSSYGSNVLFRISEKSIIHAPVHPSYYTSGQLENDEFSSSVLKFIAQHNNFDLIEDPTMIAKSNSTFISIEDVVFNDFNCTNALFCRKKSLDLKHSNMNFDFFDCAWDFCSEHPWLACLNVENGCVVVHHSIQLLNFTFLWYPTTLDDVTIIQGESCVFIRQSKLYITNSIITFYCNIENIQLFEWNHLAFTNNTFVINGITKSTIELQVDQNNFENRVNPNNGSSTVIGTCPRINLKSLLNQTISEVQISDFTSDRLNESEMKLQNVEFISSFEMTVSLMDTTVRKLTWLNTETSTAQNLPEQRFRLQQHYTFVSNVTRILGIDLPLSVSYVFLKFSQCGFIKNLCTYKNSIPNVVIEKGRKNRDTVIDFEIKSIVSLCTNEEQDTVRTEHYNQFNIAGDGTIRWIDKMVTSSFYVTPPSLIMMSTSQNTPYSVRQSLLILFNRRIEVFLRDESVMFTMTGDDNSTVYIKAKFCTLLSSQISIQNSFLNLSPSTNYTIHLAKARLFQFDGHVPCLEKSISFSTN
jgi:hypothetical protein